MNIGTQQVWGRKKLPCRGIPSRIPWVTNGLTFWGLPTLFPAQAVTNLFPILKKQPLFILSGGKDHQMDEASPDEKNQQILKDASSAGCYMTLGNMAAGSGSKEDIWGEGFWGTSH